MTAPVIPHSSTPPEPGRPLNRLLNYLEAGSRDRRVNTIDFLRSVAIVSVVLFHYGYLPGGSLGVELFFLISGFLVSKPLIAALDKKEPIRFWHFFVYRGFKIWPSLYFFLAAGLMVHVVLYQPQHPDVPILPNFMRYLLLYVNYDPFPLWYHFQHVWSLCVEEHFYILLPLIFMGAGRLGQRDDRRFSYLTGLLLTVVGLSITSKLAGLSTLSATQNHLDALSEGVLLRLLVDKYPYRFKQESHAIGVVGLGFLVFIAVAGANLYGAHWTGGQPGFDGTGELARISFVFIPLSFFLIMWGLLYFNIRSLACRVIAHFSYNWYLWHQLLAVYMKAHNPRLSGLMVYLLVTFALAVVTTICIEKSCLDIRRNMKLTPV